MRRVLVLYYSQSGDVKRAAEAFTEALKRADVELVWAEIRPQVDYPYPWRNPHEFFDVFPECVNREPPPVAASDFDPDAPFDLVILAYQVWFLAPSLPVQGFLQSEQARVLQGRRVITLIVCRNMWYTASETMKELVAAAGGILIDNVVVTYKGPPLATFITTPRKVLSGRGDTFLGLPAAEAHANEAARLQRLGQAVVDQLGALDEPTCRSLLRGMDAVHVDARYAIMERMGWSVYHSPWAKLARWAGQAGSARRKPIIYLFMGNLVLTLPGGVAVSLLLQWMLRPLLQARIDAYVRRLQYPSGDG